MDPSDVCAVCCLPSQTRCSGCHVVAYCSREHQKQNWKVHRAKCAPYKIAENPELGRHLIALRPLSAGDIILQETPLVSGPLQTTPPICLGCYKLLNELNSRECVRCGWLVCSVECQDAEEHQAECRITTEYKKTKVKIQNLNLPHPNYQSLTVLRCLNLKHTSPKHWEKLTRLQSHCEERRHTDKYKADMVSIAQFIRRFYKFEEETEEEIMRVAGIVEVNAHEVPLADPGYVSIYELASFLEHDCNPNCSKSFTSEGGLVVRAAGAVPRGAHLSICYTDPLWGTASRRHHLRETKFFECRCQRCEDPTELNTHFSSLRCPARDCGGNVTPTTTTINTELYWACEACGKTQEPYDTLVLLDKIGQALSSLEKDSPKACQAFIREQEKVLSSNHYFLTDVKLALVQFWGQDGLAALSEEDVSFKTRYCQQLLTLFNTLAPAESRVRGVVLFELHGVLAEAGRRASSRGVIGPEELRDNLLECRKVLQEAYKLLSYEPEVLPEGQMALQALKNMQDLDRVLRDLKATLDMTLSLSL